MTPSGTHADLEKESDGLALSTASSSSTTTPRKRARVFLPTDSDNQGFSNVAQEGDVVVLYAGYSNCNVFKLEANGEFGHRHGVYRHEDIIGARYGTAILPHNAHATSRKRNLRRGRAPPEVQTGGYALILPVTPELWSRGVDTRTQITFALDNCMIASHLHLKPGQTVCESGTGSGALTTFLARAVGPRGRVYTFEFNETRFQRAKDDFEMLGLDSMVRSKHVDVYADGFGKELDGQADAVFLDLPNPWLALPHAARALKPLGRICSFSPCIEQVQRSTALMSKMGFSHLQTVTVTLVEHRNALFRSQCPGLFKEKMNQFRSRALIRTALKVYKRQVLKSANITQPKNLQD